MAPALRPAMLLRVAVQVQAWLTAAMGVGKEKTLGLEEAGVELVVSAVEAVLEDCVGRRSRSEAELRDGRLAALAGPLAAVADDDADGDDGDDFGREDSPQPLGRQRLALVALAALSALGGGDVASAFGELR